MLYIKFQPNMSSGSGEKVDFRSSAFFSNGSHFYHSEALQPYHAACEF